MIASLRPSTKSGIKSVALSNPDLKFLGHLVARDFYQHWDHIKDLLSQQRRKSNDESFVPLVLFDYDAPGAMEIRCSNMVEPTTFCPYSKCSSDKDLHGEWFRAVSYDGSEGTNLLKVPLLVLIPRGLHPQVMTALLMLQELPVSSTMRSCEGISDASDPVRLTGMSWIHVN
jgi:hypothetical protein